MTIISPRARGARALTRAIVAALAAALLALIPAPAQAGPDDWVEGTSDQDTITNCTTGTLAPGVVTSVAWRPESDHVPYVGERFVVRMTAALVGNPCSGGVAMLAEMMAPTGLIYADDESHPVRWGIRGISDPVALAAGGLTFHAGSNGGVLIARDTDTKSFILKRGEALDIEVPVVATRELKGIATRQPECENRRRGVAPCPPEESGDHWQTAFRVGGHSGNKSYVTPYVGLFAQPKPGSVTTPPGVAAAASRTKASYSLKKGRPVSVTARVVSSAVVTGQITVSDRGKVIARARLDNHGRVQVRLPRLSKGRHPLSVTYLGSGTVMTSSSKPRTFVIR